MECGWSAPAAFETSLMHPTDWSGVWVSDRPNVPPKNECTFYQDVAAPRFRTTFRVEDKASVAYARAYVTGLGYYTMSIMVRPRKNGIDCDDGSGLEWHNYL